MTPAIDLTSVPAWAVAPSRPSADVTGRYWSVVAFDDGASTVEVVAEWIAQLDAGPNTATPRVHHVADDDAAQRAVAADLTTALVGWRLMIAGPADACLRLRAFALERDVTDDEMIVATTSVRHRDVHCGHCHTSTRAAVELGEVVACSGCSRKLSVQQHVSRRIGAHLGVMVDVMVDPEDIGATS